MIGPGGIVVDPLRPIGFSRRCSSWPTPTPHGIMGELAYEHSSSVHLAQGGRASDPGDGPPGLDASGLADFL